MNMTGRMGTLAAAGLLYFASGIAQSAFAAISVTGTDVSGAAGSLVTAPITFSVGTDYPMIAFDMALTYMPSQLTLVLESSTFQVGASPAISYSDFLTGVSTLTEIPPEVLASHQLDVNSNMVFSLSGFAPIQVPFVPISGLVTMNAVFKIAGDLAPGTVASYSVSGALFSPNSLIEGDPTYNTGDIFSASPLVTVTAVPEPQTWMMLFGGLGLLGGVAYRRRVQTRAAMVA